MWGADGLTRPRHHARTGATIMSQTLDTAPATTLVTRRSSLSGREHTLALPLSPDAYAICAMAYDAGMLLQDAFPMLSADEREFVKTGITAAEWTAVFGEPE